MKHLIVAISLVLSCAVPLRAGAQSALPAIDPPRAGDCSLTIRVPANTDPASVSIALNSAAAPLKVTVVQRVPLVATFMQPLLLDDEVIVTVGPASVRARVTARDPAAPAAPCAARKAQPIVVSDGRKVFEASGFVGEVFDNFAPDINGGYSTPVTATDIHARVTAGIEAQYRLIGKEDGERQLWVAAHTLHGLRTADLQCPNDSTIPACLKKAGDTTTDQFNYILAHASTIEANVDARLELFTLQRGEDTPAKIYVYGRAGFLDLEGAPRVFDNDAVGVGIIAPKGVFRNSYAQIGWGVSKQYESDHAFDRLKINGVLVFDVMPHLSTGSILGKLGKGSRFFVAIAIDRNPSHGPDAVQTYVGADFDLRQMFGSFN